MWYSGCTLGFRPRVGLPIQLRGFDSRHPLQKRLKIAKHILHIPIKKAQLFIKNQKREFNSILKEKKYIEYYKILGKGYYTIEIEKFIKFFKIDKDITYALKNIEYFNSKFFIKEIAKILNFSQFKHLEK